MFSVIFFMFLFIVFYLIYYFIFNDMLKKKKYAKISELGFLVRKFNLDKKKMDYKKCLNGVAIINAFIISLTIVIVDILPINIMFTLIVAFVILMVLIYTFYTVYGKYLYKKWGKNNGV